MNKLTINKSQRMASFFKTIILSVISILLFNCNSDNNEESNISSTTKLYAIDGVGSELKIVEVNPENGDLESVFLDFEPKQARVDFNFTYLKTTNELLIRENVFENGIGPQLIKVDIDTKETNTISSEDFSTIIAGNDELFGFKRIFNNTLLSINLVKIDPENASTILTMEIFEALDNAPQNDKTGISSILYSHDTNELLIPRRISFVSNAIDELIKINASTGSKETVSMNHYESVTVGRNGRLFAVKRTYDPDLGEFTFYGVVEVDTSSGNEIDIIKKFDNINSFSNSEIIFLSKTNEILVDIGTLYKINVDTKVESILSNNSGFYSYRSVNIY